jgi:hypothetical protein
LIEGGNDKSESNHAPGLREHNDWWG